MPNDGSLLWNLLDLATFLILVAGLLSVGAWRVWLYLRAPLTVTYLIPQEHYGAREFPGAPAVEQHPDALNVSAGEHIIMFRVWMRREAHVLNAWIEFPESDAGCDDLGPENLFVVERRDRPQGGMSLMNWHGQIQNAMGDIWPAREPHILGHRIRTTDEFEGTLRWVFHLQGRSRPLKLDLQFRVGAEDDIGFLVVSP